MIETEYSTHKSMILARRRAITLYLFDKNREKDIPKTIGIFWGCSR